MIRHMTPCTVRGLLADTSFLRYVLEGDTKCRAFWTDYQRHHPEVRDSLEEARYILRHLDSTPCAFSHSEQDTLLRNIQTIVKT